jgi:hypothetical protein
MMSCVSDGWHRNGAGVEMGCPHVEIFYNQPSCNRIAIKYIANYLYFFPTNGPFSS